MSELTKVSVIMDKMGLGQPDGTAAAKLTYCMAHGQCPQLNTGGICGHHRATSGARKGQFIPVAEIEECQWDWSPTLSRRLEMLTAHLPDRVWVE